MQQGPSSYAPSRRRSPNHSDTDGEHLVETLSATGSASTASAGLNGSARPQRPGLTHATTSSGSFVRIKRKQTSPVQSLDINGSTVPTPSSLSAGPASAVPKIKGERTVDQLASKTCFICYEEETISQPSGKKWVHPCKCSLVAHEDCLLSWITVSKPNTSSKVPVACPQCNAPYTIAQLDYPVLNLVERLEAVWARNVSKVLMAGLGAGAWTLLSWYGIWAIRAFAGDGVLQQLMRRKTTKWILAPLVLPVLVLSRTNVLDSVLPFLPLALVLNSSLDTYSYYSLEHSSYGPLTELHLTFPPNPALTLCLVPWIRAIYMSLRRRIFRAVLGSRKALDGSISPATTAAGTPPAVNIPREADFANIHQQPDGIREELAANFDLLNNAEHGEPRRVVVTVASGARILAGSLVFPGAAALTGTLLLWLAKRHNSGRGWLAWMLGVGATTAAAPATGLWNFAQLQPLHREWVDPVWWRSTVGGALLVVLKDSWSMARQIMERRRAASRRIESQAVRDGLEI